MVVTRGRVEGEKRSCLMGIEFHTYKMKMFWRYSHNNVNILNTTELYAHLKVVKIINFTYVFFTTIKNGGGGTWEQNC